MRKVELVEEEILIVKQALAQMRARIENAHDRVNRDDVTIIDKILKKIRAELVK